MFICHASEDKGSVVRPLVAAFNEAGVSCWYDEAELEWGDSITGKINDGLRTSTYVIVVITQAFCQKNWPQRELNAVMNQEASSGVTRVLPLLVGSDDARNEMLAIFPLINDKLFIIWDGSPKTVVTAVCRRLGRSTIDGCSRDHLETPGAVKKIPIPTTRKPFTDRDRDGFMHEGYAVIRRFFEQGLNELSVECAVESDLQDIHTFKFVATVYVHGKRINQCKVCIGGLALADTIAYSHGMINIGQDNSINDYLTVIHEKDQTHFAPSDMWLGNQEYSSRTRLTPEQAALYFWKRFTEPLEIT